MGKDEPKVILTKSNFPQRCRLQNVKHGKLLPLFGSEVFNSSFVSAPAEPTAGSFSRSYAEVRSLTGLYWHTQQLTRPEF
jgi:hypothetical protein